MSHKKGSRFESPLEQQRKATLKQTLATNLSVLRRLDPCIAEILEMACHAVLYRFVMETQGWEKEDMEGSLFVVKRTVEPLYRLFLLNRSGIENFALDLSKDLLLQVEGPYLMWKSLASDDILGLWIYKEEEHAVICKLVIDIVQDMPEHLPAPPPSDAYGSPGSAILAMIGADPARSHHAPPRPHAPRSADGSAILAMIGAGQSSPSPPRCGPAMRGGAAEAEAEATRSLKGLLGVAPAPAPHRAAPADGPAPSGVGANAGASSGLKGLIGVGLDPSPVHPPPPPPGAGNSAGAAAGAQILGMLGVVKGDAAAAGPGDGPAAVDVDPASRQTPPPPPSPVPPTQPPSPGAAILSMLKRDFPPAQPARPSLAPPAAPAAGPAGLLTPGHIASAAAAAPPPASIPGGHRGQPGAAAANGPAPPPAPATAAECDAQPGAQAARGLLAASVVTSMAGPAAARMSLPLFKQALRSAVEDEGFVAELYRQYLSPPRAL